MVKNSLVDILSSRTGLDGDRVQSLLIKPPQEYMGDYSLPCFTLAKEFKKAPHQIADELADKLQDVPEIEKADTVKGYLNLYLNRGWYSDQTLSEVTSMGTEYGSSDIGGNKTVIIEMSSPNIAKSFGMGHLRSTLIGNSLAKIYSYMGYDVRKLNFLGDWGTQFGKLIYGYMRFGDPDKLDKDPINHLTDVYVKTTLSSTPGVEDEGREIFRKLEEGDSQIVKLWETFRGLSVRDFNRIYDLLGVEFDNIVGESDYHEAAEQVINDLDGLGFITESDDALIVDLTKEDLGVVLMKKKDGTSIYASRDVAAAIDRMKNYHFHKMLYEVGAEQSLHFKQVFRILDLLGHDWHKDLEHIDHGLYLGSDGKKLSTRRGTSVSFQDIWDLVHAEVMSRYSSTELPEPVVKERADSLTRAAIIYSDLQHYRRNDVIFDPKQMVGMEGNTGIFLLYNYARASSLIAKSGGIDDALVSDVTPNDDEFRVIKAIGALPDVVGDAYDKNDPSKIVHYANDLTREFSRFYTNNRIIGDPREAYRLQVVNSFRTALGNALHLLGIKPLERM